MKSTSIGLAVWILGSLVASADAALITWGTPFNIENSVSNVPNTFDSSLNGGVSAPGATSIHTARNWGYSSVSVNSVSFTQFAGNTDFWGYTGINSSIDSLLSGHTALASGIGTGSVSVTGLTPGYTYQLQVIVAHDSRTDGGINLREYEVATKTDGTFSGTLPVLTRGASGNDSNTSTKIGDGTVIGTFIADSTSLTIALRSNQADSDNADDPDPAISGFVLIQAVPEPSAIGLSVLGLAGFLRFRRRRKA